jgi:hypothetical protein
MKKIVLKKWQLFGFILNLVINIVIFCQLNFLFHSLIVLPFVFWGSLIFLPHIIDSDYIISPKNYIFTFFFITIVISPPVILLNGTILTNWILDYNSNFWSYFNYTIYLWLISFIFYSFGLFRSKSKSYYFKSRISLIINPNQKSWMLKSGFFLIAIGVIGLILGAGSLSSLLAIKGQRELALQLIDVQGKGRYIVWYSCIPYGTCLIWYYFFQKYKLNLIFSFFLLLVLYIPFIPFYSFTSGRGTTLLPFIMLLALYYRFSFRIPISYFILSFFLLLSLLGIWSLYRQDGFDFDLNRPIYSIGIQVLMDSISRLDVSIAAIGGFYEGNLSFLWGKTVLAAITHPIPPWILDFREHGGTMALAKAVFADPFWDEPTGMASPLMVEGFLNFGIFGSFIFMYFLGKLTLIVERFYSESNILTSLFGLSLMFQLPFGASLQVIFAGLFWTVFFPYAVSYIFYLIFK